MKEFVWVFKKDDNNPDNIAMIPAAPPQKKKFENSDIWWFVLCELVSRFVKMF